jgi:cation diffusion facilitator family transporter
MNTGQRVAVLGMVLSGVLSVIKIVAGAIGGSTAVVADGLESAGDVFASGFVLLGLTVAAKPADENHPYGHGRVETLTGLMIGLVLTAAGAVIAFHALDRAQEVHAPPARFVIWPLIASALIKAVLSGTKFHYGKRLKSTALTADAWNDSVDILSALTALAAVTLTLYDPSRFLRADHYGGFLVGLIVIFTGLRITRETAYHLMDTMPDPRMMDIVRSAAMRVNGVRGVEKCFARKTGFQYHVDLHLEVNPDMTVRESHDIATLVRIEIKENIDWVADVLVHVEPAP